MFARSTIADQLRSIADNVQGLLDEGTLDAQEATRLQRRLTIAKSAIEEDRPIQAIWQLVVFWVFVDNLERRGILTEAQAQPLSEIADDTIQDILDELFDGWFIRG